MYTINPHEIEAAKQYAIERSKDPEGFSWDSTVFAGIKTDSNQYTVGDFGEELARIVLNQLNPTANIEIDKQDDLDLSDAAGNNFYEVKTSFMSPKYYLNGVLIPTKFFCNQIRFNTVADQNVEKKWNQLVFVLCNGVTLEIWQAPRSEELKDSLGKNNDSCWNGTTNDLASKSTVWTKIASCVVGNSKITPRARKSRKSVGVLEFVLPQTNKIENTDITQRMLIADDHFVTSLRNVEDPLTKVWRSIDSEFKLDAKELSIEMIIDGVSNAKIATTLAEFYL